MIGLEMGRERKIQRDQAEDSHHPWMQGHPTFSHWSSQWWGSNDCSSGDTTFIHSKFRVSVG